MNSTIMLASGNYFDLCDPDNSPINIYDISHALSNLCRFTGHCHQFYSVAQHSVAVSRIVPPEDAMAGLLHDAVEAVIGDVSKPLKTLLPDYRAIEDRIEASILHRFGVPTPLPESVKHADMVLLRTEQRDLMGAGEHVWVFTSGYKPLDQKIKPLGPDEAFWEFRKRFHELLPPV